ncbi:N-alpha-acetyltransferase 35 [Acropora cervicornis]|uniref:Protein MAK10 homolog n=1 Tax=Acropora cervicornis TaxID=6130 RepID=A0AAD9QD67_ACRCE|nr:N-alpha-acetyltransferase 35 [Acropora cervicornis]
MADMEAQESLPPDSSLNDPDDAENSDELSVLTNEVVSGVESITKALSKLAMSAIEMMDPKMDAGMLCNKAKKVLQFEPAVKAGLLKIKDFSAEELIGILDELIACLVTWLDGHSLVQTVFTCLYMHNPFIIEDPCLKEDFQAMTYGFKMASEPLKNQLRTKPDCDSDLIQRQIREFEAVLARLKFFKAFYLALVSLEKSEGSGVPTAKQLLSTALTLIGAFRKTIEMGIQPLPSDDNKQGTIMGFEPLVNQRLLPPSFPRYTAIFSREQAIDYTEQMVKRFLHICEVVNHGSLHIIILLVWQNNNLLGKADAIREAIRTFNSPPSISEKSSLSGNAMAVELADSFISRAARPVKSIIHALGHNRARQRDKLAHLLEEFGALQDERQHFACFGSWVLYHTLNIMIQYLLSGFELELYSPHEYHYVFWYLEFLFGWHMTCLNRAEKLLQAQEAALASEKAILEHQGMWHLYQGMRHLCQGYLRALEAFDLQGKTRKPADKFGSEKLRYERRFLPFQSVDTPQPMFYNKYREYRNLSRMNASQVALLLKVAKTNFVVAKLAAGGHKKDSMNPLEFDFQCHRAFPIIKLK